MQLSAQSGSSFKCDGIILPFWSPSDAKKKLALPKWISSSIGANEFTAKPNQMLLLRLSSDQTGKNGRPRARAVLLLGLGEPSKAPAHALTGSYAAAFNALKAAQCSAIALTLPLHAGQKSKPPSASHLPTLPELAGRIASQLVMADYLFDKYKPAEKGKPKFLVKSAALLVPPSVLPACRAAVSRGIILGEAANACRRIQNEPSNIATPKYVAAEARKLSSKSGLRCRILGRAQLQKQKMNAMLAVASGSMHEPQLVLLEFRGNPRAKKWDVALVGKGVTFDSGGISIKPSSKMDEMKFDKSGACAVIGALSACRALHLKLNVVGVAALVENMPGGHAYKPGDILAACNGTTMEILNTDAEGRVVLSDALAYTSKTYKPAALLDIATLTGACVVALGDLASGVLSEDEHLCSELIDAGEKSGERLWRLPLWAEYDDKVKSEVASVKNIGESGSAGITAGASFLKPFVGEAPWAHLDIAGTANSSRPRAGLCPGGTGVGVRLFLEFLSAYRPSKDKKKK